MEYIKEIAFYQGVRDEVPNQVLAKKLASDKNCAGIKEIAEYLNDKNKSVQSDCLKVLYEIGYIDVELIAEYFDVFVSYLHSKNNRMVWGSMIAVSNIAKVRPEAVFGIRKLILELIDSGSLITHIHGINALINVVKSNEAYYHDFKAVFFRLQEECRDIDFAKRAELLLEIIADEDLPDFVALLEKRKPTLTISALKRMESAIKKRSHSYRL